MDYWDELYEVESMAERFVEGSEEQLYWKGMVERMHNSDRHSHKDNTENADQGFGESY